MQLVEIQEELEEILDDPLAIRALVRRKYVPEALLAYVEFLNSSDPKIKKATADTIMEIANVKGIKGAGDMGNVINFNLGTEQQGLLFQALGALSEGEIIQEAEIVEEGEK